MPKRKKALLLGNGINRLSSDYSWEDLIHGLIEYVSPPRTINIGDKPFPLLYEEIVIEALAVTMKEAELKEWIKGDIRKVTPNSLHPLALDCGVSDILTTNYDYSLEEAAAAGGSAVEASETTERKYNLYRRRQVGELTVWHIHGERDNPESILLGYDQYSGYLETMRGYVKSGRDDSPGPLEKAATGKASTPVSWVDVMLSHDVYILGLTLSYVEIHLWWLLTYRARLKALKDYPIPNRIVYIYPSFNRKSLGDKLQLLDGIAVSSRRIDVSPGAWQKFYREALSFVQNA
jgi:SIR2-like domain